MIFTCGEICSVTGAYTFACYWQQPLLNQLKEEGGECSKKIFPDQSQRKYGTRPGSAIVLYG